MKTISLKLLLAVLDDQLHPELLIESLTMGEEGLTVVHRAYGNVSLTNVITNEAFDRYRDASATK